MTHEDILSSCRAKASVQLGDGRRRVVKRSKSSPALKLWRSSCPKIKSSYVLPNYNRRNKLIRRWPASNLTSKTTHRLIDWFHVCAQRFYNTLNKSTTFLSDDCVGGKTALGVSWPKFPLSSERRPQREIMCLISYPWRGVSDLWPGGPIWTLHHFRGPPHAHGVYLTFLAEWICSSHFDRKSASKCLFFFQFDSIFFSSLQKKNIWTIIYFCFWLFSTTSGFKLYLFKKKRIQITIPTFSEITLNSAVEVKITV